MFIYCFLCLFVNIFCVIVKHFGFFGHFASVCSFFLWTVVVLCMLLYFLLVVSCSCYCSWSLWLFNATLKSCFCFVVIHLHFAFFFPCFLYLWSCSLILVDLCECGHSCLYFCGSSSTAQPHCPIRNLHENQVNTLAFLHFELRDWTSSSLTF